jgi:hypothetical protein
MSSSRKKQITRVAFAPPCSLFQLSSLAMHTSGKMCQRPFYHVTRSRCHLSCIWLLFWYINTILLTHYYVILLQPHSTSFGDREWLDALLRPCTHDICRRVAVSSVDGLAQGPASNHPARSNPCSKRLQAHSIPPVGFANQRVLLASSHRKIGVEKPLMQDFSLVAVERFSCGPVMTFDLPWSSSLELCDCRSDLKSMTSFIDTRKSSRGDFLTFLACLV